MRTSRRRGTERDGDLAHRSLDAIATAASNARMRLVPLALVGLTLGAGCGGSELEFPGDVGSSTNTGSGGGTSTAEPCTPGEVQPCYTGPMGTQNVGACVAGTHTCAADGSGFGACAGERTPTAEACATAVDDDCDGLVNEEGADCACTPGATQTCYSGPPGTEGVGQCATGTQTCNDDGLGFGPCVGDVTPDPETCSAPGDEDCDGLVNEEGDDCACTPGEVGDCYSGPPGTLGVGTCVQGQHTCDADGLGFGPCLGEVIPTPETCLDALDEDCDGQVNEEGSGCVCIPSSVSSCYSGPPGTQGVGACKAGGATCDALGTSLGPCVGEVLPVAEICGNGIDDDCDGTLDGGDPDGDGWTVCDGDCCETPQGCGSPAEVNPGALELVGDNVDNDCDPSTSDVTPPAACSSLPKLSGVTAQDAAFAMDLCQTTTANPPPSAKKWGLISAEHRLSDGSVPTAQQLADMQSYQTAVMAAYGTGGAVAQKGPTFAGISNGRMRDVDDPGYQSFTAFGVVSAPPASFLAAHGGSLFGNQGCGGNACLSGTGARDPVDVRLTIRVPTNASGLSYKFRFFTAEYTYVCGAYNDFHLALLGSGAPGLPADGNIGLDSMGHAVSANNVFYDSCVQPATCHTCPSGASGLAGTGLTGATSWTPVTAPVLPGEVITLDLMVFDVTDYNFDTVALLDDFGWVVP